MEKKKSAKSLYAVFCWFLALAIALGFAMPAYAAQADTLYKTVRVGYYIAKGFQEGDGEDTLRSGYGYEYLQKIASYTGWKYEYVPGDWDELYGQLQNGQIDLLAGVAYTDERSEEVLFPASEMLKETFYIYKDCDDPTMQEGDIASYAGKRIGVERDDKMLPCLTAWMQENHVQAEVVPFDNTEDCAQAFNGYDIDAFVSAENIVSGYYGITPVELIGRIPYYIGVTKGRTDLLDELNIAISLINSQDSVYLANLKSKYQTDSSVSSFLSRQEIAWMENHPQIRVGYLRDYMPYCAQAKDGTVQGLLKDALTDLFAGLPGDYAPEIVYTAYQSQEEILAALQRNEVDVAFPVSGAANAAEKNNYQQSSIVIQAAVDLVYTGSFDNTTLQRIAVNRNNQLQYEYTRENYPDAELVLYDSAQECIRAVKDHEVGSTLIEAIRAVEMVGDDHTLQTVPLSQTCDFCFGVNYGNVDFLRVVNHGLSMLGEGYGLTHAYQYVGDVVSNTVQDTLQKNAWMLGVLVVVLAIGFLLMRYNNLRKLTKVEAKHSQALQDALMKAHQASYAKRAFLHNMSHDMRTPLNALQGFIEIEERTEDPALLAENRAKARGLIQQMIQMTDNMIHMSKLESGEMLDMREQVDFNQIANEVELRLKFQAEEAKVAFAHEKDAAQGTWPYVYGNSDCVREILQHTLENAVKYNHPGGWVRWQDSLKTLPDNRAEYDCTIADNGRGMKPEFLQYIFEPFSQERYDARTTYNGSGLGMAIVKSLLDKMGGTIEIQSEENVGTTVKIHIPLEICPQIAAQPQPEPQPQEPAAPETAAPRLNGLNILLVDDNALNIEIEQYILEDAGAAVTVANDGAEAVKLYTQAPDRAFDVILMDIMMPVMNGYEATNAVRISGKKDAGTIPIIATTACVSEDVRREGASVGFSDYMEKPLAVDKLLRMIAALMNRRQMA